MIHDWEIEEFKEISQMTQDEYIAILFADCGYDTVGQRKGWLQKRFEKNYVDELTSNEKSIAITTLKDEKYGKYPVRED